LDALARSGIEPVNEQDSEVMLAVEKTLIDPT